MSINKIRAIVAPKKKLVRIVSGKGRKQSLLKTYRFKEVIPMVEKTITVEHYDWGEWSVADRGWSEEKKIQVYDEGHVKSIEQRALNYYLQNEPQR